MNAFLLPIFVTLHVYGTLAYQYRGPAGPLPHLFSRLPQSSFSFDLDSSDDSITADDFAKVLISLPSTQRNQVYDALVSVTPFLEPGSNVYSFIDSLPNAVSDQVSAIRNPYQYGGAQRSQFAPLFNSPSVGFTSLLAPLLAGGRLQPTPYGLPHPHRHRNSPGHTCHRRHRIISPTHGIDLDFTSIVSTFPLNLGDGIDEDSTDKTNPENSADETNPEDSNKTDTDAQQDPSSEGQNEKEADTSEVDSSAAYPTADITTDDSSKSNDDVSGETAENTDTPTISETVPEQIAEVIPEESTPATEPTPNLPTPEQVDEPIPNQPAPEQVNELIPNQPTPEQTAEPTTVFSDDNAETQIENEASRTTDTTAAPATNRQTRSLPRPKKTKSQVKKRNAASNKANAASSAENSATAPPALESESLSAPTLSAASADESVANATNEVVNEENPVTEEPVRGGRPKKAAGLAKVPRKRPAPKPQS